MTPVFGDVIIVIHPDRFHVCIPKRYINVIPDLTKACNVSALSHAYS